MAGLEEGTLEENMSLDALDNFHYILEELKDLDLEYFINPEYAEELKLAEFYLRFNYQNASLMYQEMMKEEIKGQQFTNKYLKEFMDSTYKLCLKD